MKNVLKGGWLNILSALYVDIKFKAEKNKKHLKITAIVYIFLHTFTYLLNKLKET